MKAVVIYRMPHMSVPSRTEIDISNGEFPITKNGHHGAPFITDSEGDFIELRYVITIHIKPTAKDPSTYAKQIVERDSKGPSQWYKADEVVKHDSMGKVPIPGYSGLYTREEMFEATRQAVWVGDQLKNVLNNNSKTPIQDVHNTHKEWFDKKFPI